MDFHWYLKVKGPLLYRTAEEWTGNRGERGGMTCSKGPQVESDPGPLREDIASV